MKPCMHLRTRQHFFTHIQKLRADEYDIQASRSYTVDYYLTLSTVAQLAQMVENSQLIKYTHKHQKKKTIHLDWWGKKKSHIEYHLWERHVPGTLSGAQNAVWKHRLQYNNKMDCTSSEKIRCCVGCRRIKKRNNNNNNGSNTSSCWSVLWIMTFQAVRILWSMPNWL